MRRMSSVLCLSLVVLSLLLAPAYGADFAPVFPKQAAPVVASPNFTWAAGDYDYFVLYLLLPIPEYYYQAIPIPLYQTSFWTCPDALWDYLPADGWCLWLVLGINTTTYAYEASSWQYFQKVSDCVVDFPDANLQAAIRNEITKPTGDIMASDLTGLTTLDFRASEIADLSGLEYCTELTSVDLHENLISDLGPLAALVDLTFLSLYENQIPDVSPLAGLVSLDRLYVGMNLIEDVRPLAGLAVIDRLYLNSNQITDISALAGLTTLNQLALHVNQITDISPLVGLTNMGTLNIYTNQITDLGPLVSNAGIDSGDVVNVHGNPLDATSCSVHIPALEGRGVTLSHDCT